MNGSWPFGPFILTVCPSTVAVTPDGIVTCRLPIRYMTDPSSEHRKENFAAHIRVARLVVGHNSLRRRQHRNSQTVIDARQVLHRGVNPPPRLRYPLDLADYRLAVEILQLDLKLAAARGMFDAGIAADIALGLEHLEHVGAHLRARGRDLGLGAQLRIANTGDEIADRIVR